MSDQMAITNGVLKAVMTDAMVARGTAGDFDQTLAVGYYRVSTVEGSSNLPPGAYGYGILEVLNPGNFLLQRYTTHRNGMYIRMQYTIPKNWTAWLKITPDSTQ
ncbi:MAG: hypothetical protein HDS16_04975 [Bacteroides sp.]|nr:hypothetical protein [Bacteroides sp.]